MSAPYYSGKLKLMRYEDLKTHIAEVERFQNTLRQRQSLQSFSFGQFLRKRNPATQTWKIANAGAPQTTSTSSPSMCISLPAYSSISPWSPTTSYSRASPGFPDSPRPYQQEIFLQRHMEADRNGKMSSGRTYNWQSNRLRWIDLLMQDHTFLRHSME